MKLLCLLCLLCVVELTVPVVPAAPELPNPTFAPELVDGVGKWYLNFETLPGYHYIVEESQDLENWTPAPSGSFYGNGNTQRLYICDGPMWEDTPSSGGGQMPAQGMWKLRNLYMKLEMQSGNTGLVQRLSRASYTPIGETEALPAWDKALTLSLPAQTARFRYFPMLEWDDVATRTMYWVGLQVVITDNPAPAESLAPTAEEDADLNVFSHLESQLIGHLLAEEGPPSPPESRSHKFARVRRSEIDVNGNGLWDWWELLNNFDPFALQGQPGYCDPNADDDGDGSSNAQEQAQGTNPNVRDTDGDGSLDGQDTAPNNPNVTPLSQVEVWRSADPYFGWVLPGTYFNMGSGIQWSTSPVNPPGISTGTETFYEQILGEQFVSYFPTFPSESLAQWISSGKFGAESTGDYMAFFPDEENSVQSGHYRATKIKLVQRPARSEATKRSYVLVKRAVKWDADTSGTPSNYNPPLESDGSLPLDSGDPEVVTLEIPANATESSEYDLSGTFGGDAPSPGGQKFKWSLLPVEIKEVEFAGSNYPKLKSDDGNTTYDAPQWVDVNGDGTTKTNATSGEKNYPVSFRRNTKPQVGGKFKVAGLPSGQTVKIKAGSEQGLQIPETLVTPTTDGTITLPLTTSSNNLPDSIQFHNADNNTAFKIDWEISIGNGGWKSIGTTRHTVYLTHRDPTTIFRQESIFAIACRSAQGADASISDDALTEKVFSEFATLDVRKVKPSSGSSSAQGMGYWLTSGGDLAYDVAGLLKTENGICYTWVDLLRECLAVHGIVSEKKTIVSSHAHPIKPNETAIMLIKTFSFSEHGSTPPGFPGYTNYYSELVNEGSLPSQSNKQKFPQRQSFGDHGLLKQGTRYFDPSYGKGPFGTLDAWENASISGYTIQVDMVLPNNTISKQEISRKNNEDILEVKESP